MKKYIHPPIGFAKDSLHKKLESFGEIMIVQLCEIYSLMTVSRMTGFSLRRIDRILRFHEMRP